MPPPKSPPKSPPKGGSPGKKKKKKKKKQISDDTANKIQSRLKAATFGTDPATFFKRYDKDREGSLDYTEFKKMMRTGLKITKQLVSDDDIEALIDALDDDGSGTLDIDEIADFVVRGTATFHSGPAFDAEGTAPKWGERIESEAEKRFKAAQAAKAKTMDEGVVSKLQARLQAATYGDTPQAFFARYDKDGGGTLDVEEFRVMIRKDLKMGPTDISDDDIKKLVRLLDDDDSGTLGIEELADFVMHGSGTFGVGPQFNADGKMAWGERAKDSDRLIALKKEKAAKRAAGRNKAGLDNEIVDRLQAKLKAAVYGTDPKTYFSRYDKDGEGELDAEEFRVLIRKDLKISPNDLNDADINKLILALDDDESGTLAIEELADFVLRGAATFYADVDPETEGLAWGERQPHSEKLLAMMADKKAKMKKLGGLSDELLEKIRARLAAAVIGEGGDAEKLFERYDRSGDGEIDDEELRICVRKDLKIPPGDLPDGDLKKLIKALDEDESGQVSIKELSDFINGVDDDGDEERFEDFGKPRYFDYGNWEAILKTPTIPSHDLADYHKKMKDEWSEAPARLALVDHHLRLAPMLTGRHQPEVMRASAAAGRTVECLEHVLETKDHPAIVSAMLKLATVMTELPGTEQKAEEILRDALERLERFFGKGHKRSADYARVLSTLGDVLGKQTGRGKEAMRFHELAVAIYEHAAFDASMKPVKKGKEAFIPEWEQERLDKELKEKKEEARKRGEVFTPPPPPPPQLPLQLVKINEQFVRARMSAGATFDSLGKHYDASDQFQAAANLMSSMVPPNGDYGPAHPDVIFALKKCKVAKSNGAGLRKAKKRQKLEAEKEKARKEAEEVAYEKARRQAKIDAELRILEERENAVMEVEEQYQRDTAIRNEEEARMAALKVDGSELGSDEESEAAESSDDEEEKNKEPAIETTLQVVVVSAKDIIALDSFEKYGKDVPCSESFCVVEVETELPELDADGKPVKKDEAVAEESGATVPTTAEVAAVEEKALPASYASAATLLNLSGLMADKYLKKQKTPDAMLEADALLNLWSRLSTTTTWTTDWGTEDSKTEVNQEEFDEFVEKYNVQDEGDVKKFLEWVQRAAEVAKMKHIPPEKWAPRKTGTVDRHPVGRQTKKSGIIKETIEPWWNCKAKFAEILEHPKMLAVRVKIFDWRPESKSYKKPRWCQRHKSELGEVIIPVSKNGVFPLGEDSKEQWFPITPTARMRRLTAEENEKRYQAKRKAGEDERKETERLLKKAHMKQYDEFQGEYQEGLKEPAKEVADCEQILVDVAASRVRAEEDQDRSESAKAALLGRIDNMEQRAKDRIRAAEVEKKRLAAELQKNLELLGEYAERPYDESDYLLEPEEVLPEVAGEVQLRTRMTQRKQLTAEELAKEKADKAKKARAAEMGLAGMM